MELVLSRFGVRWLSHRAGLSDERLAHAVPQGAGTRAAWRRQRTSDGGQRTGRGVGPSPAARDQSRRVRRPSGRFRGFGFISAFRRYIISYIGWRERRACGSVGSGSEWRVGSRGDSLGSLGSLGREMNGWRGRGP